MQNILGEDKDKKIERIKTHRDKNNNKISSEE